MGVRLLEKVELMASEEAGNLQLGRGNEFSPISRNGNGSRGSSRVSAYSKLDENSEYFKLVRNLSHHGPRYTEAETLK